MALTWPRRSRSLTDPAFDAAIGGLIPPVCGITLEAADAQATNQPMHHTSPTVAQNLVLWGTVVSWVVAVTAKALVLFVRTKTITVAEIFGPGGMPSTHTCPVLTCTVLIGFTDGWDSSLFALSCTFAAVVMYDASGVRRAAGEHAQAINMIFKGLFEQGHFQNQKLLALREILGHRPTEVFVGAALGILVALIIQSIYGLAAAPLPIVTAATFGLVHL